VLAKAHQLLLDIAGALTGQARRGRVTLSGRPVTPGAVADSGTFGVSSGRGNRGGNERERRYF